MKNKVTKKQRLYIRMTEGEKAAIMYHAQKVGLTASELVRQVLCM
jgi:hypothetical protein